MELYLCGLVLYYLVKVEASICPDWLVPMSLQLFRGFVYPMWMQKYPLKLSW